MHDSSGMKITVTVILTNYNHARYLETSLSAIINQEHPADEIIVIDDGSTDNSLEIIGRHADNPRVRVLRNERNRGVQYSIARAVGAATSDWIVWAAADDLLLSGFLRRGVEVIAQHPDVGIVFSQLATFRDDTGEKTIYSGNDDPSSAFYFGRTVTCFTPEQLIERLTTSYLWLSGNTAIVRRDALLGVGAFIPALEWHSDWFAFYAVALRHGACVIPEALAMMRVLPATYSAAGMSDARRQRPVMEAILDVLQRPGFADLRQKFRARPCLLSPFYGDMLPALARRPRDWDLLLRLAGWALAHHRGLYRGRLAGSRLPRGLRTRALHRGSDLACRLVDRLTPQDWKGDSPRLPT